MNHYQEPSRSTRLWTPWNIPHYGPSGQAPLVAQPGSGSSKLCQGVRRMPTPQDKHTGMKSAIISHHPSQRGTTLPDYCPRLHRQATHLKWVRLNSNDHGP
jgi:hypothetical protein